MLDERVYNRLRVFALELHQHHVSRLALNQSRDLAACVAKDQVPFPTTRHSSILDRRGSLADRDGVNDLPVDCRFLRVMTRAAHTASSSQMLQQLLLQSATRLNEQTAVDGLV